MFSSHFSLAVLFYPDKLFHYIQNGLIVNGIDYSQSHKPGHSLVSQGQNDLMVILSKLIHI